MDNTSTTSEVGIKQDITLDNESFDLSPNSLIIVLIASLILIINFIFNSGKKSKKRSKDYKNSIKPSIKALDENIEEFNNIEFEEDIKGNVKAITISEDNMEEMMEQYNKELNILLKSDKSFNVNNAIRLKKKWSSLYSD